MPGELWKSASVRGFVVVLLALAMLSPAMVAGTAITDSETRFSVSAKRWLFSASRQVVVRVAPRGTSVDVDVELDRPIRPRLGVRGLDIRVRVLDYSGVEIDRVNLRLAGKARRLSFPLDLPALGRYRLRVTDADIDAGPAKVTIQPAGEVVVPFHLTGV